MRLSEEQWALVAPLVRPPRKQSKMGRTPRPDKQLLEGMLWVLLSGAQWDQLPKAEYPPKSTCYGRFRQWNRRGVFPRLLWRLYTQTGDPRLLALRQAFLAGVFSPAKQQQLRSSRRKKAVASKSWT
ncbi:transposase [Deinococcus aetherius]|uniref:transposase n=1 Tax=Deinococcus aetherius TaxID=200252 RepID=UPI003873B48D